MGPTDLDFSKLLPNFYALENIGTRDGISALFVTLLIMVCAGFLLWSVAKFLQARANIKFFKTLISGLDKQELITERRNLRNKAKENRDISYLWMEFDESLVENNGRLYNTLDAEHFFNTHTLAEGLAENRLLAAVPAFLTAIGVAGTFLGLQLGLGGMGDNSTTEGIKTGILTLLSGASIAFMTSVWGVVLSLAFNMIEKWLERNTRHNITILERDIDKLYPRLTAEYSLTQIAENSEQSHLILQTMAEKIGDRMQEAMGAMTESMREALENSLKEIVSSSNVLQEGQAQGSQKLVQEMIDSLLEGFTQHGKDQRGELDKAANSLNSSMENVGEKMNKILDRLDSNEELNEQKALTYKNLLENQMGNALELQNDRNNILRDTVKGISDSQHEVLHGLMDTLKEQVASSMDNVGEKMNKIFDRLDSNEELNEQKALTYKNLLENQMGNALELQNDRNNILRDTVKGISDSQHEVLHGLANTLKEQVASSTQILNNTNKTLNDITTSLSSVSENMRGSAGELEGASGHIKTLGNGLGVASDLLTGNINKTVASTANLAERLEDSFKTLEGLSNLLEKQQTLAGEVIEDLGKTSRAAQDGFGSMKKHQLEYIDTLKEQVEDLAVQMQKALNEYAKKVSDQTSHRMDEWNGKTGEYTSTMMNAVSAIANAVDEIETKIRAVP